MYPYVDELYPHQTHLSIPFTICVDMCAFFFFEMPLNLFGQSEQFETHNFGLTSRLPSNLITWCFCPCENPLFLSGEPYHYLYLKGTFCFRYLWLCALLCQVAWSTALASIWTACGSQNPFLYFFLVYTSIDELVEISIISSS